jgi:hypothetical protein
MPIRGPNRTPFDSQTVLALDLGLRARLSEQLYLATRLTGARGRPVRPVRQHRQFVETECTEDFSLEKHVGRLPLEADRGFPVNRG